MTITSASSSRSSSSSSSPVIESNYDMTQFYNHETTSSSNNNNNNNCNTSSNDESESTEHLSPAYTQLLNAITHGNLSMVKQMIDYGLNVNYIYDKEKNYSFLHLACLMGNPNVIK